MGNKAVKETVTKSKSVQDPGNLIKNAEKKLLISWTTDITKKWFDYHLINYNNHEMTKLLLQYTFILCNKFGFDGYGITLINQEFFMKMSCNIIDHVSTKMDKNEISDDVINKVKELLKSFWDDHIVRIQNHFAKEYPTSEIKLQDEPNMSYLQQIISENKGIVVIYLKCARIIINK